MGDFLPKESENARGDPWKRGKGSSEGNKVKGKMLGYIHRGLG